MTSTPLTVCLVEGRAEVRNGRHVFYVAGRQDPANGSGCPVEMIGAALGS